MMNEDHKETTPLIPFKKWFKPLPFLPSTPQLHNFNVWEGKGTKSNFYLNREGNNVAHEKHVIIRKEA